MRKKQIDLKRGQEIKIGIVVLSAIALLVYGFYFLKGQDIFKKHTIYHAKYDNISGLTENNGILLNGFKVGKIKTIALMPGNTGKILVSFYIDNPDVRIPIDSEARIESMDLLGTKTIGLRMGKSVVFAEPGDTLQSSLENSIEDEVNAQIKPLKDKTVELISSIDSAVTIVKAILNEDARKNLSASFSSIKKAIGTFELAALRLDTLIADEKIRLEHIFANLESITNNVKNSNEEVTNILENFSSISDTLAKANLAQTVWSANQAIKEVAMVFEKINRGEGSLGMLVHNDTLYSHVEQAAKDLDLLLFDLQKNPDRYLHFSVFGKKNKNGMALNKDEEERLKVLLNGK